jgi:hypothetical protein
VSEVSNRAFLLAKEFITLSKQAILVDCLLKKCQSELCFRFWIKNFTGKRRLQVFFYIKE